MYIFFCAALSTNVHLCEGDNLETSVHHLMCSNREHVIDYDSISVGHVLPRAPFETWMNNTTDHFSDVPLIIGLLRVALSENTMFPITCDRAICDI